MVVSQLTTTAAHAKDNAVTGLGISVYDSNYMANGTVTLRQAVTQAKEFRIIVARPTQYRSYVPDMRAANPSLTLLAYLQGLAAASSNYPKAYYAHDRAGRRIKLRNWNLYLMEPSNPGWRHVVVDQCKSLVASSGYNGCFLDQLGVAPLRISYVTSIPASPATGTTYTQGEWLNATGGLGSAVNTAIAPKPVFGNGLVDGSAYYDSSGPSSAILKGLWGAMSELWLRGPTNPIDSYPTATDWKKCVDMVRDAASRGKTVLTMTKVWRTATAAQIQAWHRFALGSFLLGYTPGKSLFEFRSSQLQVYDDPLWNIELGNPQGAYTQATGGAYMRVFAKGKVLVNPSTSSVQIALGKTMKTYDGRLVSSVVLKPHTAEFLF